MSADSENLAEGAAIIERTRPVMAAAIEAISRTQGLDGVVAAAALIDALLYELAEYGEADACSYLIQTGYAFHPDCSDKMRQRHLAKRLDAMMRIAQTVELTAAEPQGRG